MYNRQWYKLIALGIICFMIIFICWSELSARAVIKDNNRLAKPTIRDLRYIYARYEIPITNDGRFGWDPEMQVPGGGRWLRGTNEGYIFGFEYPYGYRTTRWTRAQEFDNTLRSYRRAEYRSYEYFNHGGLCQVNG